MRLAITSILLYTLSALSLHAEITIEWCVEKARANYPVIKKYGLTHAINEIDLSDIDKSWLPGIGLYGQLTAQNCVPTFPESLSDVLDKMGQNIKGMDKVQYKTGVDLSQTIWDGGTSSARREVTRKQEAVQEASLDIELYQVRQKVENIYFALLLTEEQMSQASATYDLLIANLEKLRSMLRNGTAMQADLDMVEAQALELKQNISLAHSASDGYRKALGIFTGENLENERLAMPSAEIPLTTESNRPELKLFDRQLEANSASQKLADTSLSPRIGLFTQAYYGYPGFNYFQSMADRKLSFNVLAGVKVSWNIDAFYTRKNNSLRTALNAENIAADREIFLFNSNVQSASQTESINGLREVIKADDRIVNLRSNVRKAAESQLENGVIDTTALLTKINDENLARLTAKYHKIQLLQKIYELKYTLDR